MSTAGPTGREPYAVLLPRSRTTAKPMHEFICLKAHRLILLLQRELVSTAVVLSLLYLDTAFLFSLLILEIEL